MAEISKQTLVLGFLGLCALHIVASLDATALSVALPVIAQDLKATTVSAYWTGTGFVLASAVLQPVFTAVSHAFGRRPIILLALTLFAIGTIVCGTAPNIAALLSGRAIQGAGCGGMLAMSQVVIADLFVLQKRALAIAIIGMVWLFGTSSGPVMGGGFTDAVTWRWIFWFCLPFVGIALMLITLFLRTPHRAGDPGKALKEFDWVGAVIFIAALTSLLMGITWGGTMFAWSSYHTIVPLVLGGAGLAAFGVFETFISKPMLPLAVFRYRTASVAFSGQLFMGIVQFAMTYFLPLYYEVGKGYSPLIAGVAIMPNCMCSGLMTAITGRYISKSGHYRSVIWVGWVLLSLGTGLLVLLNTQTNIPSWIFINVVSGMGMGCLFSSLSIAAMAPQPPKDQPTAAALSTFFRTVGNAFGIAIGNAVYQNVIKLRLDSAADATLRSQAETISQNAENLRNIIRAFPAGPARDELTNAFLGAVHALWWTLMGISLAGLLTSLVLRHHSLGGGGGGGGAAAAAVDDKTVPIQASSTATTKEDSLERGESSGYGTDGAVEWEGDETKSSSPASVVDSKI